MTPEEQIYQLTTELIETRVARDFANLAAEQRGRERDELQAKLTSAEQRVADLERTSKQLNTEVEALRADAKSYGDLQAECSSLEQRVRELEALVGEQAVFMANGAAAIERERVLREALVWFDPYSDQSSFRPADNPSCPACAPYDDPKLKKHASDCWLARALAATRKEGDRA